MLSNIVPRSDLEKLFGDDFTLEEYGIDDLATITKKKPKALHATGGNIWSRIVVNKWNDVDPQQLARYFQAQDPKLYRGISKVIGEDAIRDIYFAKAWRGAPRKQNLVMELMIAEVYPGDLHLCDVTFINPDKPIPPLNRRFDHQTHRGLGLLPTLLDNMQNYAKSRGLKQLTLTAASGDLVPLFKKHGFEVEDSHVGRFALDVGMGIPLERNV